MKNFEDGKPYIKPSHFKYNIRIFTQVKNRMSYFFNNQNIIMNRKTNNKIRLLMRNKKIQMQFTLIGKDLSKDMKVNIKKKIG